MALASIVFLQLDAVRHQEISFVRNVMSAAYVLAGALATVALLLML
jgi:hypothetical protein